jgi:hypothetical protein
MNIALTDTVLMVSPDTFAYDRETAISNTFQKQLPGANQEEIRQKAFSEFSQMAQHLRDNDITVLTLTSKKQKTPDAVFPNNWFSTDSVGNLVIYSMMTESRRKEKQINNLMTLLFENNYHVKRTVNFEAFERNNQFLEGTGSMSLDRKNKVVYAALSARTHIKALEYFASAFGYSLNMFNAPDTNGIPIYHTNVLMNIGDGFAVVCLEAVTDMSEKDSLKNQLEKHSIEIIDISREQMNHFCGNILQVRNKDDKKYIVMSTQAYGHFSDTQRQQLENHGTILHTDLTTIETIGGGSARCMMAEIFLPRMS